jgi:hypothetical protein
MRRALSSILVFGLEDSHEIRISVLELGAADGEQSLAFYRDGLYLTYVIVGGAGGAIWHV